MLLASLAPCRFPSRPCRWAVPDSVMWVPEWSKGFDPKQVWDALSFVTAICWSHVPNSNYLPLSNMHFVWCFFFAMLIECVFTFRSYEPIPCSLVGEAANLKVAEVAAVRPDRNSNSIQLLSTPFRFTVSVLWLLQSKPQARSVPNNFDVPKKRWPRQGQSVGRCSYCFIFQRLFSLDIPMNEPSWTSLSCFRCIFWWLKRPFFRKHYYPM